MNTFCGRIIASILLIGSSNLLAQVPEPRMLPSRGPEQETPTLRPTRPLPPSIGDPRRDVARPPLPASSTPVVPPSGIGGTAATILVTTVEDTGSGSLRKAIEDANDSPGSDVIGFQIPFPGVQVIAPKSPLPLIDGQLTIDGTTVIGYMDHPLIQIDGSQAGPAFGLQVYAAGCTFKALSITRFSNSGIVLLGASTTIEGCYIGLEPDGTTAAANGVDGITVYSADNRIGVAGGHPNVVSGNARTGIVIEDVNATGNIVVNCYAGTNAAATAAVPNVRWGVEVVNATDAVIGGTGSGVRNVLSGNGNAGVGVRGQGAQRVTVQGNYIGTGLDPAVAIPNQNHGVEIAPAPERGSTGAPSDVLIGGVWNSPEGNLISGSRGSGVAVFLSGQGGSGIVVAGNIIGLDAANAIPVPNEIGISIRRDVAAGSMPPVRIGGFRGDSCNVIAGNSNSGMYIMGYGARNNDVRGNYIGVVPLPGGSFLPHGNLEAGIVLDEAGGNEIGGPDTLSGNVLCANRYGGMHIYGDNAAGNSILNNYIGTAPGRPRTLGNGDNGIYVMAPGITIGRANPDNSLDGNIIAWNARAGIYVGYGQGTTIRGNSIYRNGTMGVDLGSGGLTPNDTTDSDTGPNTLVNYPIIESVTRHFSSTDIKFRILGEPNKEYTVDFYANDTLSASLFGEGKDLFAWVTVTTGPDGTGTWEHNHLYSLYKWEHVTAIATDADGNSSEFCRAVCLEDTDNDGLMDCWEKQGVGIDVDMNGLVDLDLYARGANWDHKDLFVEVDRMAGMEFVYPARDMSEAFFRTAPNSIVDNPDRRDGISLHIQYVFLDDSIPKAPWPANPWLLFHAAKKTHFGTGLEREHPNAEMLLTAKKLAYRYCIFADRYGTKGSSGLAEAIGGNDFIVTLGNWSPVIGGTVEEQAGTFVHELGHTLGLRHGGGDNINYKPNYISVMNYSWQFPQPKELNNKLSWKIIFSPSALPALDESRLDETAGLGVPNGTFPGTVFPYGNSITGYRTGVLFPGAAVDWNGNDDSSGADGTVAVDLNGADGNSPGEFLLSHNDWSHVQYNFREFPNFPDPGPGVQPLPDKTMADEEPEMDWMMRDSLAQFPPYGFLPPERVPYFHPRDTSAVGGNWEGIPLHISIPAPAGGLKYYFRSSAPDLMTVDREITLFQGNTEATVGFNTIGVERDTTIYILSDSLEVPLYASVRIRPAGLNVLNARTDSGCVITELGGFKNRYLAGCTILFEAELDGQAPPAGGILQLSSSRTDLIDPPPATPIEGFARSQLIAVRTAAAVSSPQAVILTATYRDTSRSDTVIIMPAPQYDLTDLGWGGSSTPELKINNAGQVLINRRGFRKDGVYTGLSWFPGFRLWNVMGINDSGWVCGSVLDSGTIDQKPAYWKPDTTIVLPTLDAANPSALVNALNNRGELVGVAIASAWPYFQKPVIWRNGTISELERYQEFWLNPVAINDSGQIIGTGLYHQSSPYINRRNAFRWDDGVLTRIERPDYANLYVEGTDIAAEGTALLSAPPLYWLHDGAFSPAMSAPAPFVRMTAYDMNDSLDVVGSIAREGEEDESYVGFPFVRRGGYQYDLACLVDFPPNWSNSAAVGINNSGTIVGYAWDSSDESYRLFMLTPAGPDAVEEPEKVAEIPTEFQLFQNYPNPFNPATVIRYGLPQVSDVTLEVYSILGQRVRTLVDGRQTAGTYEVKLDGSSLASGVYIYRLRAGAHLQVRKMMLVK